MARGRKPQLKIGDPVTKVEDGLSGVIAHISTHPESWGVILDRPYDVHWYPNGRGSYSKSEIQKKKPSAPKEK